MRITFKKGKPRSGRMRLADTYHVNQDGKKVANIQRLTGSDMWFWYCDGVNTCCDPAPLDRVKSAVKEYFKSH
jgi:hypothetical protein